MNTDSIRQIPNYVGRYLTFSANNYYPGGGMWDCVGAFATIEEAIAVADGPRIDFVHILDTQTGLFYDCNDVGDGWFVGEPER